MVIDQQQITSQIAYDGDQNFIDTTPLLTQTKEVINQETDEIPTFPSKEEGPLPIQPDVLITLLEV